MAECPWWRRGVIYQIAVPSFADSNGDGIGDLRGIIGKLDYLNDGTPTSLGVDAIWLTPICASPMRDFGYDVSDYRLINPRLGTMHDFEQLLAACHERGIRVMMDLALNHTSDEHPWFVQSRSSRDNPRRDWYVWREGRAPGRPPNRWRAVIEGSAWECDSRTGEYYYHAFLPFQPDLNWRNPAVRQEMLEVTRFWLERGVDGFRLDLVNFLYEDAQLRDNPPRLGFHPYGWQRHLRDRSQPENLDAARALRRVTDQYPGRAMMGEVYTDDPAEAVAYLGEGNDALHLSFYLDFAKRRSARGFRRSVEWLERHIPPESWPCYYLNNHDLPRTYTRLSRPTNAAARAKVVAAMLLTLRGTPILYYGEEIGMPTSRVPRRLMDDPVGRKFWPLPLGRDGSRTPMQWTAEPTAGFTSGRPWLPVDASRVRRNVEAECQDPDSLLTWYRSLIRLRRGRQALQAGSYETVRGLPRGTFGYVRQSEHERIVVLLNFGGRSVRMRSGELAQLTGSPLLSTHRDRQEALDFSEMTLRPYEALIAKLHG